VEREIGLDLVVRLRSDERLQGFSDLLGAGVIDAGGGQCGGFALDPEPEVDHVEHVVMRADGGRLDRERRRRGHGEHERAAALEGLDEPLGTQPGHRLADNRS
jgi:hypothetical protein